MRRSLPVGKQNKAFTLIEIMVAMVIFAIMMTALFASFRTGLKAFTMGTEHARQQQIGRFAINQVAKDMHNIFYKPESEYNVARRQQEALIDSETDGLRPTSSRRQSDSARGDSSSGRGDDVDENLPDPGPPIDLSFTGQDNGDIDQLSLVTYMGFSLDNYSVARITYYVIDGSLYRATDDIARPETDENGNVIPKENPPQIDKLADNCVEFDLKYGYYHDGDWLLADSWDSSASQYRNPPEDEDDDILNTVGTNVSDDVKTIGASGALQQQVQQQQQQARSDNLPSWVVLSFKFATDKDNPDSVRTYRQTIVMNSIYAVETYVPNDEDEQLKGARSKSKRNRGRDSGGSGSSKGST